MALRPCRGVYRLSVRASVISAQMRCPYRIGYRSRRDDVRDIRSRIPMHNTFFPSRSITYILSPGSSTIGSPIPLVAARALSLAIQISSSVAAMVFSFPLGAEGAQMPPNWRSVSAGVPGRHHSRDIDHPFPRRHFARNLRRQSVDDA